MSGLDAASSRLQPDGSEDGTEPEWTARTIRDRRPLYVRVVEEFEDYVREHQLEAGARLPSESQLADLFGVGRSTIREAMSHLELVGIVERRHGLGTVLTDRRRSPVVGLETLEALENLAARQGWECGTDDVRFDIQVATEEDQNLFDLGADALLTRLVRTKTRNSEPFAVLETRVPTRTMDSMTLQREFTDCFVELLMKRSGSARLDYIRAKVSATSADDPELRERLNIESHAPLVVMHEYCMSKTEVLLAINRLFFIPDAIELEVIRRP